MFLQQLTLCSSTQTVDETFLSVKYIVVMMSAAKLFIDFLSILRDHKSHLVASCQGLCTQLIKTKLRSARCCHLKEFYLVFRILFTLNVYLYVHDNKFKKIYDFRVSLSVRIRIHDNSISDVIFHIFTGIYL